MIAVAIITSVMSYRLNKKKNEAEENYRAAVVAEKKEAEQKEIAQAARDKAEKAQAVTGAQRNLALDVVRGISVDVDSLMRDKLSLAPLRMAIQKKMLSDVDKIRDHAAKNPLDDRGEAVALARLGDIYLQANRVRDAAGHYRRVRAIFEQFIQDHPEDAIGHRNLAAISNKLADVELRLGHSPEARDIYSAALDQRLKWSEMVPGHAPARQAIAESYTLLGGVNLELGEPAIALENYHNAEKEYSELPSNLTGRLDVRRDRIEIRERIGECHYKLGQSDQAEKELQDALKDRQALVKAYPRIGLFKRDVALTRLRIGDLYMFERKQVIRAFVQYARPTARSPRMPRQIRTTCRSSANSRRWDIGWASRSAGWPASCPPATFSGLSPIRFLLSASPLAESLPKRIQWTLVAKSMS